VTATLLDNYDSHTGINVDDLAQLGSVKVVATDIDGDAAEGTVNVSVSDDVPVVTIGGNDNGAPTSSNVNEGTNSTGNWTLTPGADGVAAGQLTITADGSSHTIVWTAGKFEFDVPGKGTMTLFQPDANGNGTWSFIANQVSTSGVNVSFTIRATDGDGDQDTDSHVINIIDVNQPLVIGGAISGVVEEEHGLPGGLEDVNDVQGLDTDESGFGSVTNQVTGSFADAIQSGVDGDLTFNFAALSGNPAVVRTDGQPLTSGGQPVLFAMDGGNLVGYVNNGGGSGYQNGTDTKVFTLTLDHDTGDYTFTLNGKLDHHPVNNADDVENIIAINLNGRVTVSDDGGPAADTNVPLDASITVIDDIPVGTNMAVDAQAGVRPSVNIVLMIDTSGSMGSGSGSRMELAKAAAINLLNNPDVDFNQIMVVNFGSSASINTESGAVWTSKADAIAYINSLSANGNTNYDAALNLVRSNWGSGPSEATKTISYFISDGAPNPSSSGIDSGEQQVWENFLNGKVDVSYAIGVGSGVNTTNLDPVSWAPGEADLPPVLINNASELNVLLTGSLPGNPSGNIFDNGGGFGADGGHVQSVEYNGHTYTFDGTHPQVVITDALGGKLIFNFVDNGLNKAGDWDYYAPTNNGGALKFDYTLVDGDGDHAKGSLIINVKVDSAPGISDLDVVNGDATVYEAGLADGSHAGDNAYPASQAGTFTVNSKDGISSLTIDGQAVSLSGPTTITTGLGNQLTVNSVSGPDANGNYTVSYTYKLNDNEAHNKPTNDQNLFEDLTVKVVDNDASGTKEEATSTLRINIVDDTPAINLGANDPAITLTTQDAQTIGAASDTDSASFASAFAATITPGADGVGAVSWTYSLSLTTPGSSSGLSSNGAAIKLFMVGGEVVGTTATTTGGISAANTLFKIAVDATGKVTLTQNAEIDHVSNGDTGNYDQQLAKLADGLVKLNATATVTDGDGDVATSTKSIDLGGNIQFADDGPTARNDVATVIEGQGQNFNIAFVIDFSGSISNSDFNLQRTGILNAAKTFFEGTSGDVSVSAIAFANGAYVMSGSPYTTYAAFETAFNAISSSGNRGGGSGFTNNTNYTAALNSTMAHFVPVDGATNHVFFLSDGNPNQQGSVSTPIQSATATAWNAFINNAAYDVEVTSIGVGSGIQTGPLQAVDVDGNGAPIMLSGFDALVDGLVDIISIGDVSGNILLGSDGVVGGGDDDGFGADGPGRILSIKIGSVTYTWDGNNVIDPDGPGANIAGTKLTNIATPEGGKLTFDFATGEWSYVAPEGHTGTETFAYTLVDGDGDTSSANLTINVVAPMTAQDDIVLTNITDGSPIAIPTAALLHNDGGGTQSGSLNIQSVGSASGGTVAKPGEVVFDPTNPPTTIEVVKVYNFDGATTASSDRSAYYFEVNPPNTNKAGLSDLAGKLGGTTNRIEANNAQYVALAGSDNSRWDTSTPGGSNSNRLHAVFWSQFQIAELVSSISKIDLKIEGHQDDPGNSDYAQFGIWNVIESKWDLLDQAKFDDNDGTWGGAITGANISKYVDGSNNVTIALVNSDNNKGFDIDHVELKVTSEQAVTQPFAPGSFEYVASDGMSQDTGAVTVKAVEGNTITGTNADEVLIGGSGDDTLNGGSGKDYLIGGAGNDILNGGAGDDILAGGLGKDTLTGGADADTFVIDPSALTAGTQMADIITDYKIGEGDVVDLSELLGGNVTADNIGDFVRTVEGGNGAADQLQVNQSGSGNDADFVTVAHLNTDAGVKILYDDDLAAATVNHTP
jgi:uncharacterized protein YegL